MLALHQSRVVAAFWKQIHAPLANLLPVLCQGQYDPVMKTNAQFRLVITLSQLDGQRVHQNHAVGVVKKTKLSNLN